MDRVARDSDGHVGVAMVWENKVQTVGVGVQMWLITCPAPARPRHLGLVQRLVMVDATV